MFIPFDQMPETSRVWVYQSSRPFSEAESSSIFADAETFLTSWTAHSQTLKASCQVAYHQFLILSVDEGYNAASGCSIDKSVHFVQDLETRYQTRFFERTLQAFLVQDSVQLIALKDLKQAVADEQISPETPAFHNLVETISQLNTHWIQPAGQTWLARYFKSREISA
jgi:hypothetical protein